MCLQPLEQCLAHSRYFMYLVNKHISGLCMCFHKQFPPQRLNEGKRGKLKNPIANWSHLGRQGATWACRATAERAGQPPAMAGQDVGCAQSSRREEAALEFWDTIEAKTSSVFGAGPGTWLVLCFLNEHNSRWLMPICCVDTQQMLHGSLLSK